MQISLGVEAGQANPPVVQINVSLIDFSLSMYPLQQDSEADDSAKSLHGVVYRPCHLRKQPIPSTDIS